MEDNLLNQIAGGNKKLEIRIMIYYTKEFLSKVSQAELDESEGGMRPNDGFGNGAYQLLQEAIMSDIWRLERQKYRSI